MRIGIYVGSFNPVHKGHINNINYLLENNYLDKVIVIPTGNYWNKNDIIELFHRINMLKMYETSNIKINTNLNNLEYTYQIFRKLNKKYKSDSLFLIMGADNIINFKKWKNYQELLKYQIIVMNRDNIDIKKYINTYKQKDNFILANNKKNINISSTKIRNAIKDNKLKEIDCFLDKKVLEYILENNIYGG